MTKLFSQRYGYTSLADAIIREDMTESIQNAICNCYDKLPDASIPDPDEEGYVGVKDALTEYLWCNFLLIKMLIVISIELLYFILYYYLN